MKIIQHNEFPELQKLWLERAWVLMPVAHVNRHRQWASGRVALSLALKDLGLEINLLQAKFLDHQSILELPKWKFSLSHTDSFAAAWLLPKSPHAGMGLDIEDNDRVVPYGVSERMKNAGDSAALSPLELWCIKEAAYKTLLPELQESLWLKSIVVKERTFTIDGWEQFKGEWQKVEHPGLIVIQAQVKKS